MMTRVAFVTTGLNTGGAEQMRWKLVEQADPAAIALLVESMPDVTFLLAGEGADAPEAGASLLCDRMAGRTRCLGRIAETEWFYPAFDIAMLVSAGEEWPNVLDEEMACGMPCMVTDIGDSVRIVGVFGEVAPSPRDVDAFAAAIGRMLDRPESEPDIRYRVRARVVAEFPLGCMIARTEKAVHWQH